MISYPEFNKIYQSNVDRVLKHWTVEMQREISVHCYGWAPGQFDFIRYLRNSSIRYHKALKALDVTSGTVCDIGGFWGVFPITLSELGFKVTMTESLQYYGEAFNPLFDLIRERGVTILDYDPFGDPPPMEHKFDIVTIMAVLEHYPHSLQQFMNNAISLMSLSGKMYIEVPNVAYLAKRVRFFLQGHTPYTPLRQIYLSAVPFIGHHHEFTMSELYELADLTGLKIINEEFYNYFRGDYSDPKMALRHPLEWLVFKLWKSSRETLSVVCVKKDGGRGVREGERRLVAEAR